MLTVGASLQTPTYYTLDDEFDATLTANFNSNYIYPPSNSTLGQQQALSDIFISNYNLRTPLRFNLGASFFVGKRGFLSADLELVDYSSSQLSSNDFSTTGDNRTIENLYETAVNIKAGGELRHDIFRLRAGYARFSDPFKEDSGIDRGTDHLTFGAGIKLPSFFFDLGFVNSFYDSDLSPYTLPDGTRPTATVENSKLSALFTVGFTF